MNPHRIRALRAAVAAAAMLSCAASMASAVRIDFGTAGVSTTAGFAAAVGRAGISLVPAPTVLGLFLYESTTPDTDASAATGVYTGAVQSLEFTVGTWLAQALSGIAIGNSDITIENNEGTTANNVTDRITVQVRGFGGGAGGFSYSFTDPGTLSGTSDDVIYDLDRFTLVLAQNPPGATTPTLLTSDALPTRAQWESTAWTAQTVRLRFNPRAQAGDNETVAADVEFVAIPEPTALALAGLALGAAGWAGRRRAAKA